MNSIRIEQNLCAVSAMLLVEAYADIKAGGPVYEPDLISAALDQIKKLITYLERHGVSRSYNSSALVHVFDSAYDFNKHVCTCAWCIKGSKASGE